MLELTVRLVGSLAVVIGLLLLITKLGSRRFQSRKDASLRVVQTQSLSRSTGVSVVEVYGRVLVLGTSDTQVNVLAELSPDVLVQAEETVTPIADSAGQDPSGLASSLPRRLTRPRRLAPASRQVSQPVSEPVVAPEPVFEQTVFASAAQSAPLRAPVAAPVAAPVTAPVTAPAASASLAGMVLDEQEVAATPAPRAAPAEALQEQHSLADLLLEDFGSSRDDAGWRGVPQGQADGPLAGSILSASTWRQAMAVARGRA